MPWSHPGRAHARADPAHARDLGTPGTTGKKPRVPRRVLHAHLDDADVHADRHELRPAQGVLAAVGPLMTEVAGRGRRRRDRATRSPPEKYLREVTLPAIERGLAKAGASARTSRSSYPGYVVTRRDREGLEPTRAAASASRSLLTAPTPAYRPVLEMHGWGELQTRAERAVEAGPVGQDGRARQSTTSSEQSPWVGTPDEVVPKFKARFGGAWWTAPRSASSNT